MDSPHRIHIISPPGGGVVYEIRNGGSLPPPPFATNVPRSPEPNDNVMSVAQTGDGRLRFDANSSDSIDAKALSGSDLSSPSSQSVGSDIPLVIGPNQLLLLNPPGATGLAPGVVNMTPLTLDIQYQMPAFVPGEDLAVNWSRHRSDRADPC